MNKSEKLIVLVLGLVLAGWIWHSVSEQKKVAEAQQTAQPKDLKDLKDPKDLKDLKDLKDSKDLKDPKDLNDLKTGWFVATPATWPEAFAAAKATGKPVFVDVWATWCKNCLAMEKTTFANAGVKRELENYAVVRLQAEDIAAFAALPEFEGIGIKGIPAFVVFPPEPAP